MTKTSSAMWRTIARSWEMSSRLSWNSRARPTSRFASCACADASSDASGQAGLAAARLADEPDDLAALDGEARARNRSDTAAAAPVVLDDEVVDLQGLLRQVRSGSTGQASRRPFTAASGGTSRRHCSSA